MCLSSPCLPPGPPQLEEGWYDGVAIFIAVSSVIIVIGKRDPHSCMPPRTHLHWPLQCVPWLSSVALLLLPPPECGSVGGSPLVPTPVRACAWGDAATSDYVQSRQFRGLNAQKANIQLNVSGPTCIFLCTSPSLAPTCSASSPSGPPCPCSPCPCPCTHPTCTHLAPLP